MSAEPAPVAVVTGANRGIGLALARNLLDRGYVVVGTVRDLQRCAELVAYQQQSDRLRIVEMDVDDQQSISRAAQEIVSFTPRVDLLVNNAGIIDAGGAAFGASIRSQQLGQLRTAPWLDVLRVNTVGPALVVQALLSLLLAGENARVINMSSDLGSLTRKTAADPHRNYYYDVSKAGQNMVTRLLAADLHDLGITVVSLTPGWVRTGLGGDRAPLEADDVVGQMMDVVERLEIGDTGGYIDREGASRPW